MDWCRQAISHYLNNTDPYLCHHMASIDNYSPHPPHHHPHTTTTATKKVSFDEAWSIVYGATSLISLSHCPHSLYVTKYTSETFSCIYCILPDTQLEYDCLIYVAPLHGISWLILQGMHVTVTCGVHVACFCGGTGCDAISIRYAIIIINVNH